MSKRNKFLTEAMGMKWHKCQDNPDGFFCLDCADGYAKSSPFGTWDGFGELWEWCTEGNLRSFDRKQDWWSKFLRNNQPSFVVAAYRESGGLDLFPASLNHPDRFADALYKFLKDQS